MQLIVENGHCRTNESAALYYLRMKNQMEGRVRLAKDGTLHFPESGHNIETFKSHVKDAEIVYIEDKSVLFEGFYDDRPLFKFKRKPLHWQESAANKIDKLIKSKSRIKAFAFFYSPGGGKSASLTHLTTKLYCAGEIDAAIIITPNMLVCDQWVREEGALERDTQDDIQFDTWLWKKGKRATEEYERTKQFDGLRVLSMNVDAMRTKDGFARLKDFIKHHKGRVLFAIDEVHTIGNTSSQRHKKAIELGGMCVWRAGLSGTPISKDLTNMFAIFRFLDPRILGFKYATGFRNRYCITRWNGFGDEVVGHKNVEELYEKIAPYSERISSEEMGLDKIYDEFVFDMSDEQKKHYDKVKQTWMTQLDNGEFANATIALTAALKLQQISNGFIVSDDGSVQHLENNRIKALDSWLETIPEDEKVVIWVRFKEDARLLMQHFGDKAVDLSGNVSSDERIVNKDLFINDPKIRFVVASPNAAGTGIDNMQSVCNRAVYYATSEHFILRAQSEDRISRIGGSSTAFITDLVCRKSPDRKILNNLKGKKDLSSYTLDEVRQMFED